jgi:hypothetical protein
MKAKKNRLPNEAVGGTGCRAWIEGDGPLAGRGVGIAVIAVLEANQPVELPKGTGPRPLIP